MEMIENAGTVCTSSSLTSIIQLMENIERSRLMIIVLIMVVS